MHLTICNAELHIHTFALCMTTITGNANAQNEANVQAKEGTRRSKPVIRWLVCTFDMTSFLFALCAVGHSGHAHACLYVIPMYGI